ncbi:LapA family protein [Paraferrimonas haliotis]|uniref:LapA family protein n=1 Tax=Paraferrimonas haliotis TaxID=2013866 RepID=UPI000BA92A61|nr:lipopolysaccharide assembly protein LapA domain-containing protein [Paraferrimonas haliotis]
MKTLLVAVIVILLFLIALAFGAQNEQLVSINYFVAQGEFRLPVVLSVTFIAGFASCWLISIVFVVKLKLALRKATRLLHKQQKPNHNTKPVTTDNA